MAERKIKRSLSIRIENDVRRKMHIIAEFEGRSNNAQIIYLIRRSIDEYEKEYGEINLDE